MATPERDTSRTIQSLDRTLDILEALLDTRLASVSSIASEVEMSPGAVHHHLATLEQRGYVENENGVYRLGIQFLPLGGEAREHEEIYRISKDAVDDLARSMDATARLIVERNGYGITIYRATGETSTRGSMHLGTQEHLHSTAAGKALLAELPPARSKRLVSDVGLPQFTEYTLSSWDELSEELESISERGIAFDYEEQERGVMCVAGAITTEAGEVLGALSVSAPISEKGREWFTAEAAEAVRNKSGVVELNLTYSEWM